MNVRPWLAASACAAALTLVTTSAAAASTAAVQHAAARAAAPPSVRVKGLHPVTNVPAPHTVLPRMVHGKTAAPDSSNALYTSNWAGYTAVALKNVQLRFVAANLNVPSINCANSPAGSSGYAEASQWVGLDGLGKVPDGNSTTVEQTGVTGYCQTGSSTPGYYVWYEMVPDQVMAFTGVNPGDTLNLSVYYNSGTNQYNLVLNDTTNDSSINVDESCPASNTCLNSSAEVISEAPGGGPPTVNLADYAMENFTTADVTARDGFRGNLSTSKLWTNESVVMLNATGSAVIDQPSSLQGGQAFSTQWVSSS